MARCGYCNKSGLELQGEGGDALLEPHTMRDSRKRCKRFNNPSLVQIKFQNEMSDSDSLPPTSNELAAEQMWVNEYTRRGSRTTKDTIDEKSKIKAIEIKRDRDKSYTGDHRW